MRGPLLPPNVPGWRSRAERFDMAVLEAYEPIERRWQERVSGLDVAVDEIPRISPKDPEAVQWPPEVVADGPIALARLIWQEHPGYSANPTVTRADIQSRVAEIARLHRSHADQPRGHRQRQERVAEL